MNPKQQMPKEQDDRVDDLVEIQPDAAHDEGLDDDNSADVSDESADEPDETPA